MDHDPVHSKNTTTRTGEWKFFLTDTPKNVKDEGNLLRDCETKTEKL